MTRLFVVLFVCSSTQFISLLFAVFQLRTPASQKRVNLIETHSF
jgi:hypothetical protein